jgi:hypothetical protein
MILYRFVVALIYVIACVLIGATLALVVHAAPRCSSNSPPGPTIGHVIKLYGC